MKDKKILVLVGCLLAVLLAILYLSRPLPNRGRAASLKNETLYNEIIRAFVEKNIQLSDELKNKAQRLVDLEEKVKKIRAEKDALSLGVRDVKAVAEELSGLTRPLKEKISAIEEELDLERFSSGDAAKIDSRLNSLKKTLNNLDSNIKKLIGESKGYKIKANQSQQQLFKTKDELAALKKQLNLYQAEYSGSSKELDSVVFELQKIKKIKADLENKLSQAEIEKATFAKQTAILESGLLAPRQAVAGLKEEKERLLKERDEAAEVRQRQNALNRDLESRILELSEKNKKLEDEMFALKTQYEKVNLAFSSLKEEYEKFSGSLEKNEVELARRAERILQFQEAEASFQLKLEELKLNLETQIKESATLRQQCVEKQMENQSLRNKLNQMESNLTDLQSKWEKASNIFQIRSDIRSTQPENTQVLTQDKKIEVELVSQPSSGK